MILLDHCISMAWVFAKGCRYFIPDDRDARAAANKNPQDLDGSSLETIRMLGIMVHIKG